jgi:molecular chaperone HscB
LATIPAVPYGRRNYFDLFDLPIGFCVDPVRLSERYRTLIDPGTTADPRRGGAAPGDRPFEVEQAYRTLSDPLARAAYLLDLLGNDRDDDQVAERLQAELMAQMELQESLRESGNRPDPAGTTANVLTQLAERGAYLEKDLHQRLSDPSPSNLDAARDILRRLELIGLYHRQAIDPRPLMAWHA